MKINLTTLIEKLEPTQLAEVVRISAGQYYVLDPQIGIFSKREAEFLASQLRAGLVLSIVNKALMDK